MANEDENARPSRRNKVLHARTSALQVQCPNHFSTPAGVPGPVGSPTTHLEMNSPLGCYFTQSLKCFSEFTRKHT